MYKPILLPICNLWQQIDATLSTALTVCWFALHCYPRCPTLIVQGSVFLSAASSGYRGSPHAKLAQQPPASPLNNQSD